MNQPGIKERGIINECIFNAIRSSGPGGQNVNKVSSKVELRFRISESMVLLDTEKQIILLKLNSRITVGGELILTSQTERSQLKNKEHVIERFCSMIDKALRPVKKRKPTTPTRSSQQKRIENKKKLGEKKRLRNYPTSEL
jgi:ribosome-associated protein